MVWVSKIVLNDLGTDKTKNVFLMTVYIMVFQNMEPDVKQEHRFLKTMYVQVPWKDWIMLITCPDNKRGKPEEVN